MSKANLRTCPDSASEQVFYVFSFCALLSLQIIIPAGYGFRRVSRIPFQRIHTGKDIHGKSRISAILETQSTVHDTHKLSDGYQLHIYPLYTEFKTQNCLDPDKTADQLQFDMSTNVPVKTRNRRTAKKRSANYQRIDEPELYEKRIFHEPEKKVRPNIPKCGKIRYMSKKSSIELRNRAARIDYLALRIDFTFSDDLLINMSINSRT
ncbi:MAG TPA: hypothetical protein DHV36_21705 [Desulfobacteraceae bacterium]|nr:hypothetical protein [Desulfobacteraceae bacterium]|tara:strand:- start:158 stop:781 length:624 start_codon:yes stop_codon:yes gene_type:complete